MLSSGTNTDRNLTFTLKLLREKVLLFCTSFYYAIGTFNGAKLHHKHKDTNLYRCVFTPYTGADQGVVGGSGGARMFG